MMKKFDWMLKIALFILILAIEVIGFMAGKEIFFIVVVLVEVVLAIHYFKQQKKLHRLLYWLEEESLDQYFNQNKWSEEIPYQIRKILIQLSEAVGKKYSSELSLKKMQYAMLQSQINPHFLYNTLESIRGEAVLNDQMEIASMTEHLSRFFRYCISKSNDLVKVQEELNNVKDYFFIQKFRFSDRFDLEISCEDRDAYHCYMPKMTLQPLVENAIEHGLKQCIEGGLISISIILSEKRLHIRVSDNGTGMTQDIVTALNDRLQLPAVIAQLQEQTANHHNGLALSNVNNRIRLCFGNEYGMRIHSLPNWGTDISLVLPAVTEGEKEKYQMNPI